MTDTRGFRLLQSSRASNDTASVATRWTYGDRVVWRSLPQGRVGYTLLALVIADDEDAVALFQPSGTVCKRRLGRRGGPQGRSLLGWDGEYEDRPWHGPDTVRLHVVTAGYSVLRRWDAVAEAFQGWYVNLELPWRRTPIGFDSRDLVLDVAVSDDLLTWSYKDRDEFDWAGRAGRLSADDAATALEQAQQAVRAVQTRAWPFSADWTRWRPDRGWSVPVLPVNWCHQWSDRELAPDLLPRTE